MLRPDVQANTPLDSNRTCGFTPGQPVGFGRLQVLPPSVDIDWCR